MCAVELGRWSDKSQAGPRFYLFLLLLIIRDWRGELRKLSRFLLGFRTMGLRDFHRRRGLDRFWAEPGAEAPESADRWPRAEARCYSGEARAETDSRRECCSGEARAETDGSGRHWSNSLEIAWV